MEIAVLLGAAAALALSAALLGIALGRYLWPAVRAESAAALMSAQLEAARLGERVAGLLRQAEEQSKLADLLEVRRETAAAEAARLKAHEAALLEKIADQEAQLARMQTRLTAEFENIANRVLKASA